MSTYIKLSDVQKIINNQKHIFKDGNLFVAFEGLINSLPSISFEEIIKQEIERINTTYNSTHSYNEHGKGWVKGNKDALQELLNKLPK